MAPYKDLQRLTKTYKDLQRLFKAACVIAFCRPGSWEWSCSVLEMSLTQLGDLRDEINDDTDL